MKSTLDFAISLIQPSWERVYVVPHGNRLPKGRNGISLKVILSARGIAHRFGCYSWATTSEILYVGSFAKDYASSQFETNFEGRVQQYLTNHKRATDGTPKNTNARVFDLINQTLDTADVMLQLFHFESLRGDARSIDFTSFATDSNLVLAVEGLLIWTYKNVGQCKWNGQVNNNEDDLSAL
jgi:hypothetical protein